MIHAERLKEMECRHKSDVARDVAEFEKNKKPEQKREPAKSVKVKLLKRGLS